MKRVGKLRYVTRRTFISVVAVAMIRSTAVWESKERCERQRDFDNAPAVGEVAMSSQPFPKIPSAVKGCSPAHSIAHPIYTAGIVSSLSTC
jgi:hypothetical protein